MLSQVVVGNQFLHDQLQQVCGVVLWDMILRAAVLFVYQILYDSEGHNTCIVPLLYNATY